jgi:hypothetical protein
MPKPSLPLGYYQLEDDQLVKLIHDSGPLTTYERQTYGGKVICEDPTGERIPIKREDLLKGKKIKYHPRIPEIYRNCGLDKELPDKQLHHQLRNFFKKLIEFDRLKIRTLGYYYKKAAHNKETIGDSLAYKLAETFYFSLNENSNRRKETKELLDAWAQNPTDSTRQKLFDSFAYRGQPFHIQCSRNCPVTGENFEWECDGKTIFPTRRLLSMKERKIKTEELRARYQSLQEKENLSEEEKETLTFLTEVFTTDYGWMKTFQLTHLEQALPFQKAFADPLTKKFPKAVVEIEVPTGELVFANSLFSYLQDFPKEEEHAEENSVSHTRGRNNNIFFHAKTNNAFYVPLSNCSPEVWQHKRKRDHLRIGCTQQEKHHPKEWRYVDAKREWTKKGQVCTDLWAFHACDRSLLPEKIEVDYFIVKIPPGKYQLINHYEHEGPTTGIYCEILRIP